MTLGRVEDEVRVVSQIVGELAIRWLHPIILAVLNLASRLQGLGEQVAKVIVVWCVLESKITDVGEVFVKFLCNYVLASKMGR